MTRFGGAASGTLDNDSELINWGIFMMALVLSGMWFVLTARWA